MKTPLSLLPMDLAIRRERARMGKFHIGSEMTQLFLIRHATNDWVGQRIAGRMPGIHLNEEGRRQAQALAERLADIPLAAIYSSPLERTVQTAGAIAAGHGLPVIVREGLAETDMGEWTDKEIEELRRTDIWAALQRSPGDLSIPGGETLRQVQARIVAELDRLCATHPQGTVVAVSHADPIKLAVAHYLGLNLDNFQRLTISPASLTVLWIVEEGTFLARLNDTGTLALHKREGS
jgi:probable phosphomutase (TIGR03848 family)